MGEAPRVLADVIAPTIDVTQFLLLNREVFSATYTDATIGSKVGPQVPPGELWYIHAWGVWAFTGAGQSLRLSTGASDQGVSHFPLGRPSSAAANEMVSSYIGSPIWIGPGVYLTYLVEALNLGAFPSISINAQASFTRLKI